MEQFQLVLLLFMAGPVLLLLLRVHLRRRRGKSAWPDWLPAWAVRLFWYLGLPCWLAMGMLIISGNMFAHETLCLVLIGGLSVPALVATWFQWRAMWRGEV